MVAGTQPASREKKTSLHGAGENLQERSCADCSRLFTVNCSVVFFLIVPGIRPRYPRQMHHRAAACATGAHSPLFITSLCSSRVECAGMSQRGVVEVVDCRTAVEL